MKIFILFLFFCCVARGQYPEMIEEKPDYMVSILDVPNLLYIPIYTTERNFVDEVLYKEPYPYLCKKTKEALTRASLLAEQQGLGIIVYDAYRPYLATLLLWRFARDKGLPLEYVASPAIGSDHNRGAAVDVGLYCLKSGKILIFPTGVDCVREIADNATERESNARKLRHIMTYSGFTSHRLEWWHYSYRTSTVNPIGNWGVSFSNEIKPIVVRRSDLKKRK